MIAHEHISVPFYMESGKASVDLKPEIHLRSDCGPEPFARFVVVQNP
jgi:hypothetical protein